MEVASQLCWRGLACVATVAALLLFGQEVDGHRRPFRKLSSRHVAGCQIGFPRSGRPRTPQIIGFPWPTFYDKMGIPQLALYKPAGPPTHARAIGHGRN